MLRFFLGTDCFYGVKIKIGSENSLSVCFSSLVVGKVEDLPLGPAMQGEPSPFPHFQRDRFKTLRHGADSVLI